MSNGEIHFKSNTNFDFEWFEIHKHWIIETVLNFRSVDCLQKRIYILLYSQLIIIIMIIESIIFMANCIILFAKTVSFCYSKFYFLYRWISRKEDIHKNLVLFISMKWHLAYLFFRYKLCFFIKNIVLHFNDFVINCVSVCVQSDILYGALRATLIQEKCIGSQLSISKIKVFQHIECHTVFVCFLRLWSSWIVYPKFK